MYRFSCANPFVFGLGERDWNGEGYALKYPYEEGAEITYPDAPWVHESSVPVPPPREYRHTLSTLINGLVERGCRGDQMGAVIIRTYRRADRPALRMIDGTDEFARPELLRKNPRLGEYMADQASRYYEFEPESTFVAEVEEQVVGALRGMVDTARSDEYERRIRPLLIKRFLSGAYGLPLWLWPDFLTDRANKHTKFPRVDLNQYPAHLHIGVRPEWRRQGVGTALMTHYADYLCERGIAGFHLFASSFHPLGMAFYRKLRLTELAQFEWRFHNGIEWLTVTETIFGRQLK